MFFVGRIVPVHPASDAWLVSGHFTAFPKSARREIAEAAAGKIIRHPELLRRNAALLRQAWEIQAITAWNSSRRSAQTSSGCHRTRRRMAGRWSA